MQFIENYVAPLSKQVIEIIAEAGICPSIGLRNINEVLENAGSRLSKSLINFTINHKGMCDVISLMLEAGLPKNTILDCIKVFSNELPNVIKSRPEELILKSTYILANDLISYSQRASTSYSAEQLIRASILSVLKNVALHIGHTYFPLNDVYKKLTPIFPELTPDIFKQIIFDLCDECYIKRFRNSGALYLLASKEFTSFKQIHERNKQDTYLLEIDIDNSQLDASQKNAVKLVNDNNVSIINGPPGSGKSTVITYIIDAAIAGGVHKDEILLLATISKAAKRLNYPDISSAQTVHMGLRVQSSHELDKIVVGESSSIKLNTRLILIDEGSFLDFGIFIRLLSSAPLDCKIVILGDEYQIAPVGIGFIFRDLLLNGTPFVKLNGNYRNSKGIKEFSQLINAAPKDINKDFENVDMLWTQNDKETLSAISKYFPRLIVQEQLDYIDDIQVLVPTHKNFIGTDSINETIQSRINPDAYSKFRLEHGVFKVNDKVMFMKNNYKKGISNGDLGVIASIENNNDNIIFGISTDNRTHYIKAEDMGKVSLAYASTIHKFNGCELDTIVLVIPHDFISILTRNEIYSAITRAKKQVLILGSKTQFLRALQNSSTKARVTLSTINA